MLQVEVLTSDRRLIFIYVLTMVDPEGVVGGGGGGGTHTGGWVVGGGGVTGFLVSLKIPTDLPYRGSRPPPLAAADIFYTRPVYAVPT